MCNIVCRANMLDTNVPKRPPTVTKLGKLKKKSQLYYCRYLAAVLWDLVHLEDKFGCWLFYITVYRCW